MALKRYEEYFAKFPGDKWKTYEFKYNVAEIYNALNDCAKAAESYDYVAMQDFSTYPKYSADIDTLGVDADDAEKMKKKQGRDRLSFPRKMRDIMRLLLLINVRNRQCLKMVLQMIRLMIFRKPKNFSNIQSVFSSVSRRVLIHLKCCILQVMFISLQNHMIKL
jgi:hypothetical protein